MSDRDELVLALRAMREKLPMMIEHQQLEAQITRAKFNALVKEGFTESQAIELCRPKA